MHSSLDSPNQPEAPSPSASGSTALAAKTYTNPVLDEDFPDPALIQAPDGFYYAYATQTLRDGRWINIQVARSSDLVEWAGLGDAMPETPGWAGGTQEFWGPAVIRCILVVRAGSPAVARRGEAHR